MLYEKHENRTLNSEVICYFALDLVQIGVFINEFKYFKGGGVKNQRQINFDL